MIKFGPLIAANLRRRRALPTGCWRLDEMVVKIGGGRMFLWRAIDDEGEVLAVVDPYGEAVLIERATGAQYAAVDIALLNARSTVRYRRDTQVFADQIKAGNLLSMTLPGATGMGGGGVLLIAGGKIVGAIGETGGADVEVAQAGAAALK